MNERHIDPEKSKKLMSKHSENGYMPVFRGTDWYKGLSPEEMQQVFTQWMSWFNGLTEEGKAIAGNTYSGVEQTTRLNQLRA